MSIGQPAWWNCGSLNSNKSSSPNGSPPASPAENSTVSGAIGSIGADRGVGSGGAIDSKRELSETELLNRDYFRGRFVNKLSNGKFAYNWENIEL